MDAVVLLTTVRRNKKQGNQKEIVILNKETNIDTLKPIQNNIIGNLCDQEQEKSESDRRFIQPDLQNLL